MAILPDLIQTGTDIVDADHLVLNARDGVESVPAGQAAGAVIKRLHERVDYDKNRDAA